MSHYFAIDIETCNWYEPSICQVGLVEFNDGEEVSRFGTLVNPECEFHDYTIKIHGILPEDVVDAPIFPEVIQTIKDKVGDTFLIHHTNKEPHDIYWMSERYGLSKPNFKYLDSAKIARRSWTECAYSGYNLKDLASKFGIIYKAHDAVEDAYAAGMIVHHAIVDHGLSLDEWTEIVSKRLNHLHKVGNDLELVTHEGNPEGDFYGEQVVLTGDFSMRKAEIEALAIPLGFSFKKSVSKKTTILVYGKQDVRKFKEGETKSEKFRKAENLANKGHKVLILNENDFFEYAGLNI
ncbi:exonuclease domain-containing protein [Ekhidna sp.]|uniref:exonuclease domain-containing protein n=1 Tax=Ekhidna sp. TaxID=2608089 RepID=UPI003CCBADA6